MNYRDMKSKPISEWSLVEIRRSLLTTDGMGLQIKTEAFNRLINDIDSLKTQDKNS